MFIISVARLIFLMVLLWPSGQISRLAHFFLGYLPNQRTTLHYRGRYWVAYAFIKIIVAQPAWYLVLWVQEVYPVLLRVSGASPSRS